ncbi:hypothetical protein P7C70_g84, partial [Phenoliferia sp. Uapishka_3]
MPFNLKNLLNKVSLNSHQTEAPTPPAPTQAAASSSRRSREASHPVIQEPAPIHAHDTSYLQRQDRAPQDLPASTSSAQPQPAPTTSTTPTMAGGPSGGSKEQAEALVKRENEAKAKRELATYEGLPEGLVLGIKMGDGAFSNVFQATLRPNAAQLAIDPTLGKSVKVAVKCVRKYELNHSQVSESLFNPSPRPSSHSSTARYRLFLSEDGARTSRNLAARVDLSHTLSSVPISYSSRQEPTPSVMYILWLVISRSEKRSSAFFKPHPSLLDFY